MGFDAALHMGTLAGVLAYFWQYWKSIIFSFRRRDEKDHFYQKLLLFIAVATVPGALSGLLLEDYVEGIFREPYVVASALVIFSFVIFFADRFGNKVNDISHINLKSAIIIGLFQMLALIPGVSRSGATISAGLFLGLKREEAAKFSFLLSAPIIFGAGIFTLPNIIKDGIDSSFIAGIVSSAIAGYFAIKFLFKFLEKRSYLGFAAYRILLGVLIFGLILAR